MPGKRKPTVIKLDEVYPDTPRELSLSSWVSSLLGAEQRERELIAQGADQEALDRAVASLVHVLQAMRKLNLGATRAGAAVALPVVERFLTHPGRHIEPAHTIYWDWTMDASCAEEVPAVEVTVASEAYQTVELLRHYLPVASSDGENR